MKVNNEVKRCILGFANQLKLTIKPKRLINASATVDIVLCFSYYVNGRDCMY